MRREALEERDDESYKKIVMEMTQKEEQHMQTKLMAILDSLKVSDELFKKTMGQYY